MKVGWLKNKPLDLSKILKGHEGEKFYSPILGYLIYEGADEDGFLSFSTTVGEILNIELYPDGKFCRCAEEILVYPSKTQRNWELFNKIN